MAEHATDAGWRTWPNAVTLVRLACIPLFWWVLFHTGHRALAAWLLVSIGATDWIDGYLARRLQQTSTIGKILDPTADRILVMTERPGAIAAIYDVPLPRPRTLDIMADPLFIALTQTIRQHFSSQGALD